MKKSVAAFLLLSIVISCCIAFFKLSESADSAAVDDGFCVIIDAGHGGMDGGTSAADGTLEKNINLEISQKLNLMLKAAGIETIMLRENDELIGDNSLKTIRERKISDIRTRLSVAKAHPNAILLSIHQNYYSVSKYNGTQVFYAPNSVSSETLAGSVQNSVVSLLQPENTRQIKKSGSNIYLLYNSPITAVMVECGFLSNPQEAEKLKTNEYQKQMAFAIMQGIFKFLE